MKNEHLNALIKLRTFMIERYTSLLDGKDNPDTAVVLQRDVARVIETSIHTIDNLLKDNNVSIEDRS